MVCALCISINPCHRDAIHPIMPSYTHYSTSSPSYHGSPLFSHILGFSVFIIPRRLVVWLDYSFAFCVLTLPSSCANPGYMFFGIILRSHACSCTNHVRRLTISLTPFNTSTVDLWTIVLKSVGSVGSLGIYKFSYRNCPILRVRYIDKSQSFLVPSYIYYYNYTRKHAKFWLGLHCWSECPQSCRKLVVLFSNGLLLRDVWYTSQISRRKILLELDVSFLCSLFHQGINFILRCRDRRGVGHGFLHIRSLNIKIGELLLKFIHNQRYLRNIS